MHLLHRPFRLEYLKVWYTGEVHFLPPDEAVDGDDKERRHLLLTDCGDEQRLMGTFAYASRQSTEADHGAANHLVNPVRTTYRGTGFNEPTYVYPSRLVAYDSRELVDQELAGRLMDDIVPIRDQLRYALGIGTGTAYGTGPAQGSYRGRIAFLADELRDLSGWDFAIVVTEALYSKQRRFQTIIPVFDAADYAECPGVLLIQDRPWVYDLGWEGALAFTPYVSSVFQHREIEYMLPLTVDEATMAELDLAMALRFAL